ncbi:hypothetical protein AB0J01_28235 [Streptomyces sp. NPDC050204]|uniref:hypothetical protein n=1 Tax=Streptomyces sp. NPDC050204 TaxID=3155514 RepID=UPI00341D34FE
MARECDAAHAFAAMRRAHLEVIAADRRARQKEKDFEAYGVSATRAAEVLAARSRAPKGHDGSFPRNGRAFRGHLRRALYLRRSMLARPAGGCPQGWA